MHVRAFVLTFLIVVLAAGGTAARAQDGTATPETSPAVEFVWEIRGGSEPFEMPQDVGIDPAGNLWVLDMAHHQFQIFSPDGEFIESWGRMGEGEGEFSFFAGPIAVSTEFGGEVAFDQDGNAYVADMANQRIQTFAPDHTFRAAWGEAGFQEGQFSRPFNLAFDAAGTLYVADFGRANVQVFDRDGTYLRTLAASHAGPDQLHEPGGLAIAPDGAIWVGDWIRTPIKTGEHHGRLGPWLLRWFRTICGPSSNPSSRPSRPSPRAADRASPIAPA
jgi:hypothetical protein